MLMSPSMAARVSLGRSVRARANCMKEAHGRNAEVEARAAASEAGVACAEENFWLLVADRLARLDGRPIATAFPPLN